MVITCPYYCDCVHVVVGWMTSLWLSSCGGRLSSPWLCSYGGRLIFFPVTDFMLWRTKCPPYDSFHVVMVQVGWASSCSCGGRSSVLSVTRLMLWQIKYPQPDHVHVVEGIIIKLCCYVIGPLTPQGRSSGPYHTTAPFYFYPVISELQNSINICPWFRQVLLCPTQDFRNT